MIKKIFNVAVLPLIIFLSLPQWAKGEVFEYKHRKGDRYRILSIVKHDVSVNRRLSHSAEILNRIAVEVTDVKDGKGIHNAVFQTSERILYDAGSREVQTGVTGFQWTREYESVFERDRLGYLTISPGYFMPVVRNVPIFPDKNLRVLERWSAEGHEVHDFRDTFGITEPYRIPFTANYQFIGEQPYKEKFYPAFSVNYRIDSRPPAVQGWIYPVRITGNFNQIVYWNRELGQSVAYEENFRLVFDMSDGRVIEFRGTAEAEFIDSEYMNREQLTLDIFNEINRLAIPDVSVKTVEEGVAISLDDIRFFPDTAVMLPAEHEKLNRVASILRRYPDRDIMVSGHAALAGAGTKDDLMQLSIDRARAVTDYLLSQNIRTADRIVVRGHGTEKPIADNSTEEGRRRNRRVEITILEN